MTTQQNDVPSYRLTPEDQDMMFQRNIQHLMQQRDERQREADWHLLVNQLLHALAGKVQALEAEVASLRAGQG
jgi:hypothetical protein